MTEKMSNCQEAILSLDAHTHRQHSSNFKAAFGGERTEISLYGLTRRAGGFLVELHCNWHLFLLV